MRLVWSRFLFGNASPRSLHVYCALFELLCVLTACVGFTLTVGCVYSLLFSPPTRLIVLRERLGKDFSSVSIWLVFFVGLRWAHQFLSTP